MGTYAEDQWREIATKAVEQGQSENDFLLSCHIANRPAALEAYRRALESSASLTDSCQREAQEPKPAGTLHSVAARHDTTRAPIVTFTLPPNHPWHPSERYGVTEDGVLVWAAGDAWVRSAYDDGEDGVVRQALQAVLNRDRGLLRRAFAHSLNTVPAQPESTADADEAFSGRRRRS